jgi:hypothetical protein
MQPRFPKRAAGRSFALTLPLWDVNIDLQVVNGDLVRGEMRTGDGTSSFEAQFGETVSLDALQAVSRGAMA